jgi:hypothetical protein
MTRSTSRTTRRPKVAGDTRGRASLVFRDFVRQLEKLDATPRKQLPREASR